MLIKIRPVGNELFRADGRTDMTMLISTFRNFAKAPKKRISRIWTLRRRITRGLMLLVLFRNILIPKLCFLDCS
jgi:hypothetical protein